jgi:hypothetical protein
VSIFYFSLSPLARPIIHEKFPFDLRRQPGKKKRKKKKIKTSSVDIGKNLGQHKTDGGTLFCFSDNRCPAVSGGEK